MLCTIVAIAITVMSAVGLAPAAKEGCNGGWAVTCECA